MLRLAGGRAGGGGGADGRPATQGAQQGGAAAVRAAHAALPGGAQRDSAEVGSESISIPDRGRLHR